MEITNEIQIGDSTHTHGHEILPSSFNTINTIVRSPQKPMPPLAAELLFLLSILFSFYFVDGICDCDFFCYIPDLA